MQGEFGLLHRALLNLVLNAAQHAPQETGVEVALETAGDWATLTVTDHGSGIGFDVQACLFQCFSRGSGTLGGTGLGLTSFAPWQKNTAAAQAYRVSPAYPRASVCGCRCRRPLRRTRHNRRIMSKVELNMDLILWRHAEAENGVPDFERALTARGRKQASRMADWLNPRLPPDIRILVSPATRAMQTAQALGRHYETLAALAPGATADSVLAGVDWPDAPYPALVVGHQPTLGQTAMRLLAGKDLDTALKKGAIWWFQGRARDGRVETVLRAVVAPDWL